MEKYGDVAVELDALPVAVPRDRIVREVEAKMDLEALRRTRTDKAFDRGLGLRGSGSIGYRTDSCSAISLLVY